MNRWLLTVELDGEWEQCAFSTRLDALAAFKAVAKDYSEALQRAILLPVQVTEGEIAAASRRRVSHLVN